jgi:hypothetical protein
MPHNVSKPIDFVEGIGEPTNARFLSDTSEIDPTGWYVKKMKLIETIDSCVICVRCLTNNSH